MWNNVAKFIQNSGTKRLALALVVSAILHVILVSGFHVRLPIQKQVNQTIEAKLQAQKVAQKAELKDVSLKKIVKEKKVAYAKKKPITAPLPQATKLPESIRESTDVLEPSPPELNNTDLQAVAPEAISQPVLETAAESNDLAQTEPQPVDESLIINEHAYQYVETDFNVSTRIDGAIEGSAKIIFEVNEANQYKLTSTIKPKGLAAIIISNLVQTSDGQLTKNGLQPSNYVYQYGNKADKTYTAKFDWQARKVDLITSKSTKIEEISDGTQDLLSFMYQFMYVAPLERMQISIATGKKLALYDYSFSGEENINTPLGEIKAIHILHESEDSDEKTELWLALDYQYVPVKIRKTEKNGKVYELVANRINTSRPAPN